MRTGRPIGYPKSGGRQKGTKNKPNPFRELLTDFANKKMKDIDALWNGLEPKDKISLFTSILKYVISPATDQAPTDESTDGISTIRETIEQLNELKN